MPLSPKLGGIGIPFFPTQSMSFSQMLSKDRTLKTISKGNISQTITQW